MNPSQVHLLLIVDETQSVAFIIGKRLFYLRYVFNDYKRDETCSHFFTFDIILNII